MLTAFGGFQMRGQRTKKFDSRNISVSSSPRGLTLKSPRLTPRLRWPWPNEDFRLSRSLIISELEKFKYKHSFFDEFDLNFEVIYRTRDLNSTSLSDNKRMPVKYRNQIEIHMNNIFWNTGSQYPGAPWKLFSSQIHLREYFGNSRLCYRKNIFDYFTS